MKNKIMRIRIDQRVNHQRGVLSGHWPKITGI